MKFKHIALAIVSIFAIYFIGKYLYNKEDQAVFYGYVALITGSYMTALLYFVIYWCPRRQNNKKPLD